MSERSIAAWSSSPNTLVWKSFEEAGSDFAFTAAWQALPDPQGMKNTKLVLNATSALEISRLLEDNHVWLQQIALYNPDYPCVDPVELTWNVVNFESHAPEEILFPMFVEDEWLFIALFPMRVRTYDAPWLGTTKSIKVEEELEQVRCLLIPEETLTAPQNSFSTHGLEIHSGSPAAATVQYRQEVEPTLDYMRRTELYINQSDRNPAAGITPAYIHFPSLEFPSWPDKVWITLMVNVTPGTLLIARDAAGTEVDRIDEFSTCARNPSTYLLQSTQGNPIRKIEFIGTNYRIKEICWNEYKYAQTSRLWINVPEQMNRLELDLSKRSNGTVYFLDGDNNQLEAVDYSVLNDGTNSPAQPVTLDTAHLAFKLILIEGEFELLQVRGLPQATVDAFNESEQRSTHIRTTLEENWGRHSAQILLPNKYYRVRVDTATSRRKKSNSEWDSQNFTEYMYFKTGDPPGIYQPGLAPSGPALEPVSGTEHYPTRGPLQELSPYVDQTMPAGAPPNEPQVLHYRTYDVGLIFNDSYIEQMYQAAGFTLGIKLLDNNLRPVLAADGEEIFLNNWGDSPTLSLTREETQYETLWNKDNCLGVSTVNPQTNQEIVARSPALELLPQTQYKSQLWADEAHRLYEFNFMTSRYAAFLHQIHDFKDAAWDHMALLDNPSFEIDTSSLNSVLQNSDGVEEWIQFEQLMLVFDLHPRPLPQQLEVTVLNDVNQSYGFLLECPEPLPAQRVQEITLFRSSVAEPIDEFHNRIKLIGAEIQRTTIPGTRRSDYNRQWIEILLLERTDLSGYKIEYRDNAADEEDAFNLFYTFAPGSIYPVGTKLIIYNGANPNVLPESTEHMLLYAGHNARSFIPSGTTVRLVDTANKIVHQRPFFGNTSFTVQDLHLVRSQDETRLFFFVKGNGLEYSELLNAAYRISFTFLRDLGNGALLLKRFGYSEAEKGQIEFSLPTFLP